MLKRRHLKMVSLLLFAATILTVAATGCSSSGKSGGKAEISFVAAQYSNATEPYWKDLVSSFEKENPNIKVNLQVVGWDVISQKVNTLISTNQAPDLLNIDLYSAYVNDGLLLDTSKLISSQLKSNFYESLYKGDQIKGVNYALPLVASVRSLYYNKDIFAKAGLTDPPKTWSELETDSQQIKEKTGTDAFGVEMTSYEGQAFFTYFAFGNGGGWKDGDKWALNSQANIEGITFLNKLINTDKVTNAQPTAINRDELQKVFSAGKLGMLITINAFPTLLKTDAPNLNYGIAPMPVNDGKPQTTLFVQDSLMAFKSTKNSDAVSKLINYIYKDSNYEKFITNEGFLPATKSVGQSMATKNPQISEFMKQLDTAQTYPLGDTRYAEIKVDAINACQKIFLGKSTVTDALNELQKQAQGS